MRDDGVVKAHDAGEKGVARAQLCRQVFTNLVANAAAPEAFLAEVRMTAQFAKSFR